MIICCKQSLEGSMIKTKERAYIKRTNGRTGVSYTLTDGGVCDKQLGKRMYDVTGMLVLTAKDTGGFCTVRE